MDDRTQRQLEAIAQFAVAAAEAGRSLWLRGGWAMDFTLGAVTRRHEDVDWFALSEEAEPLADLLRRRGWADVDRAPREQQLDLLKGDVEFGIALIQIDGGIPRVAGGPFAGEPWPATMIVNARRRKLHGVTVETIGAEAQIEIKQMMPIWVPHLIRREKDQSDIRLLEQSLGR